MMNVRRPVLMFALAVSVAGFAVGEARAQGTSSK
jgi:hypothetical protein